MPTTGCTAMEGFAGTCTRPISGCTGEENPAWICTLPVTDRFDTEGVIVRRVFSMPGCMAMAGLPVADSELATDIILGTATAIVVCVFRGFLSTPSTRSGDLGLPACWMLPPLASAYTGPVYFLTGSIPLLDIALLTSTE